MEVKTPPHKHWAEHTCLLLLLSRCATHASTALSLDVETATTQALG
jgi:hypothetical protein